MFSACTGVLPVTRVLNMGVLTRPAGSITARIVLVSVSKTPVEVLSVRLKEDQTGTSLARGATMLRRHVHATVAWVTIAAITCVAVCVD